MISGIGSSSRLAITASYTCFSGTSSLAVLAGAWFLVTTPGISAPLQITEYPATELPASTVGCRKRAGYLPAGKPEYGRLGCGMTDYRNIPELLEHYMKNSGVSERWITTKEFRVYFHLDTSMTSTISGFLRRISLGPYFSCPYIVVRIGKTIEYTPQPHRVNRYYVKNRPVPIKERISSRGVFQGERNL